LNRTAPYFDIVEQIFRPVRDGWREAFVSVVTELEMLVQPMRNHDNDELDRIAALLGARTIHVIDMDRDIARRGAEVRAATGLDLADATVVATALHAGCEAIVGNDRRCARRVRDVPYFLLDDLVKER
jgi:predicted nucleic acid-binding protein